MRMGRIEYYIMYMWAFWGCVWDSTSLDVSDLFKGHEQLTSCWALNTVTCFHCYMYYIEKLGISHFVQWGVGPSELPHGGQESYGGRHQGVWYTMPSAWNSKLFYVYQINGNKHMKPALLSGRYQALSDWPVLRRATFKVSRYLK